MQLVAPLPQRPLGQADLLAQIAALELRSLRPIRELLLGDNRAFMTLNELDAEIISLRDQLP